MHEVVIRLMTKTEATEVDALITQQTDDWYHKVGPKLIEMRDREGWKALGFSSFRDYCASVDDRFQHRKTVDRLIDRTEVEKAVGKKVPARHAYVLARLPSPEAIQMVFGEVVGAYETPLERNFETYVDRWFRKNEPDKPKAKKDEKDGWTRGDLEEDEQLSDALDRIESVYGHADRKAIQDGTVGLSRKDIIALAAFHASKMKEVQHLIIHSHWNVADSFRFINKELSARDIEPLINKCIGTAGLYYTCSVNGFDIQIKACAALTKKIKG